MLAPARRPRGRARFLDLLLRVAADDGGCDDLRELREALVEVAVALRLNGALVWLLAAVINLLHYLHAVALHHAKRREAHAVEARVVDVVDEKLRGTRVWRTGLRERDVAGLVAHLHRLVLNRLRTPVRAGLWVTAQAELHHERGDDAEES